MEFVAGVQGQVSGQKQGVNARMRRRIIKYAVVLTVGIAIAVAASWFVFVLQTEKAIGRWAALQRQNGIDVSWKELHFSGFPARVDTTVDEPQLVMRQPNRVATWKPPELSFAVSSLAPNAINFTGPGSHSLDITFDDASWSAVIEAKTLKGRALFPPQNFRHMEQIATRFAGVRVTLNGSSDSLTVDSGDFAARQPAAVPTDPQSIHPQGPSFEFDLAARNIHLPPDALDPSVGDTLGPLIAAFATEVLVNGKLDTSSVNADTLSAWRDAGGTVEFTSVELQWGPVRITADGTLALDDNLQPVGAFATRVSGLEKIITAMETGGMLSPNDAAVARITLAIINRAPADGGPRHAEIPLTLQDRILRMGPVALTQLPPIQWN